MYHKHSLDLKPARDRQQLLRGLDKSRRHKAGPVKKPGRLLRIRGTTQSTIWQLLRVHI